MEFGNRDPVDSRARAEPEVAARVFENAVDGAGQCFRIVGKGRNHGLVEAVQAASVGAQPQGALKDCLPAVLLDRSDRVVRWPLLQVEVGEDPVVQTAQSARGPYPQIALASIPAGT